MRGKPSKLYLECAERSPKHTKYSRNSDADADVHSCTCTLMHRYVHAVEGSCRDKSMHWHFFCTGRFMYMYVHAQVRSSTDMFMH